MSGTVSRRVQLLQSLEVRLCGYKTVAGSAVSNLSRLIPASVNFNFKAVLPDADALLPGSTRCQSWKCTAFPTKTSTRRGQLTWSARNNRRIHHLNTSSSYVITSYNITILIYISQYFTICIYIYRFLVKYSDYENIQLAYR